MLKLDSFCLESENTLFFSMESHTFFFFSFLLFIQKEGDPPSETEGEGGASFACYDMFFLLDSPVVRLFCLKRYLTNLRVVMSVTYICSSLERSPECLFKDDNRPCETVFSGICPTRLGMYVWI